MKQTYWDLLREHPLAPIHPPFRGFRFWFACFYYHFTHDGIPRRNWFT